MPVASFILLSVVKKGAIKVMEAFIPGENLKVVAKALQALLKVGDELYIEATPATLSFSTVNQSKTVYAHITYKPNFFTSYRSVHPIAWKLQLKFILPLFRGPNLEKKFDYFKLEYANDEDHMTATMVYKSSGLVIEQRLRLMDSESLKINVQSDGSPNELLASSGFCNHILLMCNPDDFEVTLEVGRAGLLLRNYCTKAPVRPNALRMQAELGTPEFRSYRVGLETRLNFALKPLRTLLGFAEAFNLDVLFRFDDGGRPLTLLLAHATFEFSFIVATMDPDSDSPDCGSVAESRSEGEGASEYAKVFFARCFDDTYKENTAERVLAANSDSE